MNDHLRCLIERRNWLAERIKAKRNIGWSVDYDEREYAALTWAIEVIEKSQAATTRKRRTLMQWLTATETR